jgi:glycosyltransferase involved in cell wall biosynthesis
MVKEKLVSICIPIYNAEKTIEKTLQSILNQTYKNLEIIIVDNASPDNTLRALKKFKDFRIKIYKNSKIIVGEQNWNKCVKLATGNYIAIFHADDIYNHRIVEKQIKILENYSSVLAVFTMADYINNYDKTIGGCNLPPELKHKNIYNFSEIFIPVLNQKNIFITPSAMVRGEIFKKCIPFDWDHFKTAADLDLWLRISKMGQIAILNEKLIKYRRSSIQGSYQYNYLRATEDNFFRVLDHHLSIKPKNFCIPKSAIDRYEIRRSVDYLKRAMDYLIKGEIEPSRYLLKKLLSMKLFLSILKNIKQIKLLIYWFFGVIILLLSYLGFSKFLGKILFWYLYKWRIRKLG